MVGVLSIFFLSICLLFSQEIGNILGYPSSTEYVVWFALIIGFDSIASIPLAKLRELNKAKTFVTVNIVNILVNIGLNLFFFIYCKGHYEEFGDQSNALVSMVYDPNIRVGYIFISNLIASSVKLLLLSPMILKVRFSFSSDLLKKMLIYSFPIMLAGAASNLNESYSRISFKHLLGGQENDVMSELGIFGACIKVAMLMAIFVQAFRYAAEPFFFSSFKQKDSKQMFADLMTYFVIACTFIYMALMFNIDIVMLMIDEKYRVGVGVVPILLLANLFLGIYYNLSVWYKTTDKTVYAIYFGILGVTITVVCNSLWIPTYGYIGAAWTTLICYFTMTVASYLFGQRINKIPYNLLKIIVYISLALLLVYIDSVVNFGTEVVEFIGKALILLGYAALVYKIEKPKKIIN